MSGVDFEVLDSEPDEPDEPGKPTFGERTGRVRMASAAAAALVVGAVIGAAGAVHHQDARHTAADRSTLAISAAVTPAVETSPLLLGDAGVRQKVDLAVVSAGPLPLAKVGLAWDTPQAASVSDADSHASINSLAPHDPQRVQLLLLEPCTAQALADVDDVPRLVVTAETEDGRERREVINPLGLAETWTAMAALCPDSDPAAHVTAAVTDAIPVGDSGMDFSVTFGNDSHVTVIISHVVLSQGPNISGPQRPDPLTVRPGLSASLRVRLSLSSCASALLDPTPRPILYVAAAADDPTAQRSFSTPDASYNEAIGALLNQVCAADRGR